MKVLENKRIVKLSTSTANKIAAGEVVDRPVSVVKELIENSIDAGADSIIVEIEQGGKSYIRITDNGSGILYEDVENAFERHATSKIREAEDLQYINTLGFRGEALASIAAVSRVEIITKTKNNKAGIKLKIAGGTVIEKKETGCPDGTTIIVSELFYNVPARLKFLKQDAAEANLIIDFISKISLAYSNIKFRLINNGKILFSTSGDGNVYKNIVSIYKQEIAHDLIHISEETEIYKLDAYISTPSNTRPSKKHQIFFVNGRYIKSAVLDRSFNNSYHELIPDGRYPVGFIFLQIVPDRIDVNIHPNKREIKFREEKDAEDFIVRVFKAGLRSSVSIPTIKTKRLFKENENVKSETTEQVNINKLLETKQDVSHDIIKEYPVSFKAQETVNIEKQSEIIFSAIEESVEKIEKPFYIMDLNILGTIFSTYILASDAECFYLIDQHAAHERVLYEQLLDALNNEDVITQRLLTPMVIQLSYSEAHNTEMNIELIRGLGYEIEAFGNNAFIIKAIPYMMDFGEGRALLEDVIESLTDEQIFSDKNKIEKIIGRACKKAVKANDHLDEKEIKHLLELLSQMKNPFSCPHGRPVFVKLTKYDVERMFKRV